MIRGRRFVNPARWRSVGSFLVFLFLPILPFLESPLFAAAPVLDQIYPIAVPVGATTAVAAAGKIGTWPPQVWADAPGIVFHAEKTAGQFSVEVGADTSIGPHLVRVYNETGASSPRFLIVTAGPQGTEVEPNDEFTKPQLVEKLPITINGRLNKGGDVDSFAVKLEAGQTLIAAVEAYVLASPVDAVLRLVDTQGLELALNHDDGRTLDPKLVWTAKTAGMYVLQLFGFAHPATADVKFTGSDACVYRLHLSRGPQVQYSIPLGLQRAKPAKLRVYGWNLGELVGRELEVDATLSASASSQATWRRPEFENALALPLGDGPEWVEMNFPKRGGEEPAPTSPFAVTGCIEKIGEEDRFGFAATKGDKLVLEIQSAVLGFPLDAWLAIQDATGKELVRNDDVSTAADPLLEWTAPATGSYVAVVGSVLHRAGADHVYRLSVQPARPRLEAIIAESGFAIEPGKTVKIKITARRVQGFNAKVAFSIAELPSGLTASPVDLGGTEKEVTLELTAAADAPPFNGPVQIQFREESSEAIQLAIHEMASTTLNNGVPQGFRELVIRSTDKLWLTVLAAPKPKPEEEK